MGMLRSDTDHSGRVIGSVTLGIPARDVDADSNPVGEYRWDDARLPNGIINADGSLTLDEPEMI